MNQITPHSDFLQLERKYGAIIGGMQLARLLGYQSTAALRQALLEENCQFRLS